MSDQVKIAMEAYAFGVSAALQDMGMDKEAAVDWAVKEAKASGAKSLISRLGGHARGVGAKAKEVASGVKSKAKGIAESVGKKLQPKKVPQSSAERYSRTNTPKEIEKEVGRGVKPWMVAGGVGGGLGAAVGAHAAAKKKKED